MNTAIAIATRELRERSRIFIIAGALALLPFLVAAMPMVRDQRSMTIATLAGASAINYAFAIALLLGVSIVGRELSDKRLSFYFSKPVPAWALWAGKAGAALLTIITAVAIISVPALLVARDQWVTVWGRDNNFILKTAVVACLFFFFAAHAVATMVRSRSVLLAVDFMLGVAMLFGVFFAVRPLLFRGALNVVTEMLIALYMALLVILIVAPVWQLARGRTDVRRSHAALSLALWPAIAVALLVAGMYTAWMTSTTLESIDEIQNLEQSPSGEWVFVTGGDDARRMIPETFLLHTPTGTSERLNIAPWTGSEFSRDGRMLAWTEPSEVIPRHGRVRVYTRMLTPGAKPHATPVTAHMSDRLAITADGSRMAILDRDQLRVHELASGKLLAAATGINRGATIAMYFASPSSLRLIALPRVGKRAVLYEFDVDRKKLIETGAMDVPVGFSWSSLTADATGSALYLNKAATVLDGRTGAIRTKLPFTPESQRSSVMLGDGRIAWVDQGMLRLFDQNGTQLKEIRLPIARGSVAGQAGPSKLVVTGRESAKPEPTFVGRRVLVVDLERGTIEKVTRDVYGPSSGAIMDPRIAQFTADAKYAGMDAKKKLATW